MIGELLTDGSLVKEGIKKMIKKDYRINFD